MLRVSGQIPKLARRPELLQTGRVASTSAVNSQVTKEPTSTITINNAAPIPPPSDGPRRGGRRIFRKLMAGLLIGSGGLVAYGFYDPEFRKQLESNLPPPVRDALQSYLPDHLPAIPKIPDLPALPSLPDVSQITSKLPSIDIPPAMKKSPAPAEIPSAIKKPDPAPKPEVPPPAIKSKPAEPAPLAPPKEDSNVAYQELEQKRKEEEKKTLEEAKKKEADRVRKENEARAIKKADDNKALEAALRVLTEDSQEQTSAAIQAQKIAASVTKVHTQKLKAAMDLSDDVKGKEKQWEAVTEALENKQQALNDAEKLQNNAKMVMVKLQATVKAGKVNENTQKNKALRDAEETLNNLKYELNTAIAEVTNAESDARIMQEYRELVQKGREQFKKELESILPEVSKTSSGEKLTEEELNSLIAHAHRRIEQLRRQLLEATVLEQSRIQAALDRQKDEDRQLAQAMVEREKERLEAQFVVAKLSWEAEAEVGFEERMKKQLARQAAAHSDHLAEVLKIQERELEDAFQMYLAEKLDEEQDKFREKTAQWVGRMGGIELALTARSDKEVKARKAQELWLACTALQNIIANGKPEAFSYADQLKPLEEEVVAVNAAGNNHPFVAAITAAVPKQALKEGVWTEEGLKERFRKVHKISRRVAMVDESGASLTQFLLSYIQSVFVRDSTVQGEEIDLSDDALTDTFAIVDTARYYVELGNLELAVRLMNQLKGESRAAAKSWIQDARLFLETRQAASVLLAHASAEGLGALV